MVYLHYIIIGGGGGTVLFFLVLLRKRRVLGTKRAQKRTKRTVRTNWGKNKGKKEFF